MRAARVRSRDYRRSLYRLGTTTTESSDRSGGCGALEVVVGSRAGLVSKLVRSDALAAVVKIQPGGFFRPCGARFFCRAYPGLTSGANSCRPFGAGVDDSFRIFFPAAVSQAFGSGWNPKATRTQNPLGLRLGRKFLLGPGALRCCMGVLRPAKNAGLRMTRRLEHVRMTRRLEHDQADDTY